MRQQEPPDTETVEDRLSTLCAALDRHIFEGRSLPWLLDFAAREIADDLDLPLVWIGLKESGGGIRHPTVAGPERDYLADVDVRWDDTPEGRGPTGRAIRRSEPVTADIEEDPAFEPWREEAQAHGLRSSAAVPLRNEGTALGALNLYARSPSYFTPGRLSRIQHLADHLSLAIVRHRNLEELRETTEDLRGLLEASAGLVFRARVDDLGLVRVSPNAEEVTGIPAERWTAEPHFWKRRMPEEDREQVAETIRSVARAGSDRGELEFRLRHAGGEVHWYNAVLRSERNDRGEPTTVVGTAVDITERVAQRRELERRERWYRALFENSRSAVVVVDDDGVVRDLNEGFEELSGYEREELQGEDAVELYADPERRDELLRRLSEEGSVYNFQVRLRRADGEVRHCLMTATVLETASGRTWLQSSVQDLTERVRREEEITRVALHDWLTELPNRLLFRDRLRQALTRAERGGEAAGLLYVDLNGFKGVNDRHGHEAGDRVLVETARRLSEAVREGDTVARVGGDEFVVVLPDVEELDDVLRVARRVLRAFDEEMPLDDGTVPMTAAVGVALATAAGGDGTMDPAEALEDPDELLQRADRAMYRAKREEGSALAVYRSDPDGAAASSAG